MNIQFYFQTFCTDEVMSSLVWIKKGQFESDVSKLCTCVLYFGVNFFFLQI